MSTFTRGDVAIHYEVQGEGPPLLLIAPGGMRSATPLWGRHAVQPLRDFATDFRIIAMDQRNAGQSRGPVSASDGWHTYAEDQLALLDELGIERCLVMGGCIGGAFALKLIEHAPGRISGAVLQQPIGYSGTNREVFYELFDGWIAELRQTRNDIPDDLAAFRSRMYDGDFVFSVDRQMVEQCQVPLLVLRGDDQYHPTPISEEVVRLAPHAELIRDWKTGEDTPRAVARVREFLKQHAA